MTIKFKNRDHWEVVPMAIGNQQIKIKVDLIKAPKVETTQGLLPNSHLMDHQAPTWITSPREEATTVEATGIMDSIGTNSTTWLTAIMAETIDTLTIIMEILMDGKITEKGLITPSTIQTTTPIIIITATITMGVLTITMVFMRITSTATKATTSIISNKTLVNKANVAF